MNKIMMKDIKAFTLVELLVSIILAGIVSFFVYTTIIYSYDGFSKLHSRSRNSNGIEMLISSLRDSITYAYTIDFARATFLGYPVSNMTGGYALSCIRYVPYMGGVATVSEIYRPVPTATGIRELDDTFILGNDFFENIAKNSSYVRPTNSRTIPASFYSEYSKVVRCSVYKYTYVSNFVTNVQLIAFKVKLATSVKRIPRASYSNENRIDMFVIYDDVEENVTKGQWLFCSTRNNGVVIS